MRIHEKAGDGGNYMFDYKSIMCYIYIMGILGGLGRPPLSKKFPKLFLRCVQILAGCSGVFFCLSLVERPSFIFPLIQERSLPTSRSSVIDFPSWEYYAKAFQSRDIFSSVHKPDAMAVTGIPAFRVKGLMFGLRRSVVLEDLHAGRTLFLTEGEKQEQIFVKKITREGVALEISWQDVVLDMKGQM